MQPIKLVTQLKNIKRNVNNKYLLHLFENTLVKFFNLV